MSSPVTEPELHEYAIAVIRDFLDWKSLSIDEWFVALADESGDYEELTTTFAQHVLDEGPGGRPIDPAFLAATDTSESHAWIEAIDLAEDQLLNERRNSAPA